MGSPWKEGIVRLEVDKSVYYTTQLVSKEKIFPSVTFVDVPCSLHCFISHAKISISANLGAICWLNFVYLLGLSKRRHVYVAAWPLAKIIEPLYISIIKNLKYYNIN